MLKEDENLSKKAQDKDALSMALRGSKIYLEAQGLNQQNYNQNNIKNILKDDIEEDSDLHLGLIEEDENDMNGYDRPKVLKKRNIKKIIDDDIED